MIDRPSRQSSSGFTLVELMVALMIFGMLSAAGVALLSFGVRAQESSQEHLDDLSELRRLGATLTADLAQAAPRVPRDDSGAVRRAFEGSGADFALVRRGWENHDGSNRPSLQRVEYRMGSAGLERRAWRNVDAGEALTPVVLAPGARAMRVRYRDFEGGWRDAWDPTRPDVLPVALELTLDTAGGRTIRQLFLVGTSR
jgi:general secretion pathway protein J